MRSQKISNRAPRPFKNKNSDRWSGVRDKKPFFTAPKTILRAATTERQATSPAEAPAATPEAPAKGE